MVDSTIATDQSVEDLLTGVASTGRYTAKINSKRTAANTFLLTCSFICANLCACEKTRNECDSTKVWLSQNGLTSICPKCEQYDHETFLVKTFNEKWFSV